MRMRAKRRLASEINVVPYIDVMLVLLIIFMVTAPMLTTGVKVKLPQAQAQPMATQDDLQPLLVTVTANGNMYLGNKAEQPLSAQMLEEKASKIIRQNPAVPVMVKGDGSSAYANVVQAMAILQQAGAQSVGLVTDNVHSPQSDGDKQENN